MAIYVGTTCVSQPYYDTTKLGKVYYNSTLVWPDEFCVVTKDNHQSGYSEMVNCNTSFNYGFGCGVGYKGTRDGDDWCVAINPYYDVATCKWCNGASWPGVSSQNMCIELCVGGVSITCSSGSATALRSCTNDPKISNAAPTGTFATYAPKGLNCCCTSIVYIMDGSLNYSTTFTGFLGDITKLSDTYGRTTMTSKFGENVFPIGWDGSYKLGNISGSLGCKEFYYFRALYEPTNTFSKWCLQGTYTDSDGDYCEWKWVRLCSVGMDEFLQYEDDEGDTVYIDWLTEYTPGGFKRPSASGTVCWRYMTECFHSNWRTVTNACRTGNDGELKPYRSDGTQVSDYWKYHKMYPN